MFCICRLFGHLLIPPPSDAYTQTPTLFGGSTAAKIHYLNLMLCLYIDFPSFIMQHYSWLRGRSLTTKDNSFMMCWQMWLTASRSDLRSAVGLCPAAPAAVKCFSAFSSEHKEGAGGFQLMLDWIKAAAESYFNWKKQFPQPLAFSCGILLLGH